MLWAADRVANRSWKREVLLHWERIEWIERRSIPAANHIFIWTRTSYSPEDRCHMRADWDPRRESARQHARRRGVSGPGRTRQQARGVSATTRTHAINNRACDHNLELKAYFCIPGPD